MKELATTVVEGRVFASIEDIIAAILSVEAVERESAIVAAFAGEFETEAEIANVGGVLDGMLIVAEWLGVEAARA